MEELISVIVPIYNVEKYLPRCIESIRNQSYRNLEIILVDDGATDNCPRICDEYAEMDFRIRVIHQGNRGLSGARNTGIENSTGKYIGFVDSDDYIHPEMYQRLWEQIKLNNADIAMCDLERISMEEYQSEIRDVGQIRLYSGRQAVKNIMDKKQHVISVVAWNKLYKAELFENIRFPVGKIHEDEFTTYRIFYESRKVVVLSGKYYYYFQREDSIMGKQRQVFSYDAIEAYEKMGEFFTGTGDIELFHLVKYKYLYMLKEAAAKLKRSEDVNEQKIADELDEKYKCGYKESIHHIKGIKRRFRLWLYRWLRFSI